MQAIISTNFNSQTTTATVIPQLIPISEVIKYTGLSRATIYRMIDENSKFYDPTFPKKIQLSECRIAWSSSEVAEWINNKIASRSA